MEEDTLLMLEKWFHQYVKGFYSADEQIQFHVRLKEEHTLRVLNHAVEIAKWCKCPHEQAQLAAIAALLHDIGRFKQYHTYRTFNDAMSINHAALGLEVLEQADILPAVGLSLQQQNIVKKAILYHNRRHLPVDEVDECLLLSKITRDADKLDIFAMLITKDANHKIPQASEVKNADTYSTHVIDDILQGKLVKYQDIKTSADLMLFRLSWIYDIYFTYSFSYILQQQYLEKLIAMLPDTEDIRRVYQHLQQYVKQHDSI